MNFETIDWDTWRPDDHATLVFIVKDHKLLLIHKKRGLGKGKLTGPGGKLDPGETPEACARREVHEELSIQVGPLAYAGELNFQFTDGYALRVSVFRGHTYTGEPRESPEAAPLWVDLDAIPFERMWEDDYLWIPHMLEGRIFKGSFLFDGDRMLGQRLQSSD